MSLYARLSDPNGSVVKVLAMKRWEAPSGTLFLVTDGVEKVPILYDRTDSVMVEGQTFNLQVHF